MLTSVICGSSILFVGGSNSFKIGTPWDGGLMEKTASNIGLTVYAAGVALMGFIANLCMRGG